MVKYSYRIYLHLFLVYGMGSIEPVWGQGYAIHLPLYTTSVTVVDSVHVRETVVAERSDDLFEGSEFREYWNGDRIDPYGMSKATIPFKLEFDQETFTHPVDHDIVVTSRFGYRGRGVHRGLDIDLITGDSVRTVLAGKVRFVGYSKDHGRTVVVRHNHGIETVYAHLSDYAVARDDVVDEGHVIGYGGNSGNSRGSHLHLEVRYRGECIHPEYVFNFDGQHLIRGTELWVTRFWVFPQAHSSYQQSKLVAVRSEAEALTMQQTEPLFHKVKSGDTLSHIARTYHLGIKDICNLNGISRKSLLRIGQILQVR